MIRKIIPFLIPVVMFATEISGIYINRYKASSDEFYTIVENMVQNNMNAAVIDIKYDRGETAFMPEGYSIPNAYQPIPDIRKKVEYLKQKGIRPIARIVCFKDPTLGIYDNSKYAVRYTDKTVFKDLGNAVWVSPYSDFVQNYIIDIAKEAVKAGFEEIQFDYIRFPCDFPEGVPIQPLYYPGADKRSGFTVINDFIKKAYMELKPMNVDIGADLYGYTVFYDSLTAVRQHIERIAEYADIIYPMVYPSHFSDAFLNDRTKEQRTYDIIFRSGVKGEKRTKKHGTDLVLFIQDFDWKKSTMGDDFINNQIKAAMDSGVRGYILWNPSSNYNFFKLENRTVLGNTEETCDSLFPLIQ